jgi:methionyl-tRNA formyltransferase
MNWEMPAQTLEAFIRGMTPWPGAFTFHGNKRLKIFKARSIIIDTVETPGTVIKRFPDELCVATGKGVLSLIKIQSESGKRLLIKDFLRGYKIPPGTVLS